MDKQKPQQIEGGMHDSVRYAHPAFGQITMSMCQGNIGTLFGSDIGHSSAVMIEISTANVDRQLNRDWIHADKHVMTFYMSRAQFANFITSSGDGSGTPITFGVMPVGGTREHVPGIAKLESKADVMKREIRETANEAIEEFEREVAILGNLIESGKVGIKDVRAIHRKLNILLGNLPANMEHSVSSAERALESAKSAAKIEIEGYLANAELRLGAGNGPKLIDKD